MKRKQKLTLLTGLSVLAIGVLSIVAINADTLFANDKMFTGAQCEVCSGNHYSGEAWNTSNKAKGSNGLYEYWHCCVCGKRYFFQDDIPGYDAKNWKDNGTRNQYMDTTDLDDSRIQFGGTSTLHKINHLTSGTISVDGLRDELYNSAVKYNFGAAMYGSSQVTATLEAVWQDSMLYVFVDVEDPTKSTRDFTTADTSKWTEAYDAVELRIDTLHSEKVANDSWNGKSGSDYRGDYACEGWYKAGAGYNRTEQYGDGIGCEFVYEYYMSDLAKGDGKTYVKSQYTSDTHYGMEFAINLANDHSIMNPFGEIGLGVKIYDKNGDTQDGIINFESINDDMPYHRNLSNFRLIGYGEASAQQAGESVVNEIKANASSSDWTFEGNSVTTNSVGTYLSTTSYTNFTARLKFDGYSQSTANNDNPYFGNKATKAFLFGGSFDDSNNYTGYALNISKNWIELLKLSGYSSTFIEGNGMDLGNEEIVITVTGTLCTVSKGDGTIIQMAFNGYDSAVNRTDLSTVSGYTGGKVGILCNDTSATKISIVEFDNNNEFDAASAELPRGVNLIKEMKNNASSSDWTFNENVITTNTAGHYLSTTSYTDFSAIVNFSNINPSADTSVNPFFSKIATKAFLLGGSNDSTGKYSGFAVNISKNFVEVLKLDGYSSTVID